MRPQSYCRDEMRVMSVGPSGPQSPSLLVLLRNRNARRRGRRQSLLLIAIRPPPDNKYQLMRRERVIYTALIAFFPPRALPRYGRGNGGWRFRKKKLRPSKLCAANRRINVVLCFLKLLIFCGSRIIFFFIFENIFIVESTDL